MVLLFIISQACCSLEVSVYNTISKDLQARPVRALMDGVSVVSAPALNTIPPALLYLRDETDVARLGTVGFISNCATVIPLKLIINRQRPDNDHGRWNSSFPSGHTTFAFTQAVVYSHHTPRLTIPLFLYATTVGFSRIYLGKHYPTDVIGGAILGILTGLLAVQIVD